jgi:beta-glucosidase
VVLVLFAGRPLTLQWENANVPAILDVWFGGTEAAAAIADVLFGDVNPSGKLTTTFPQNVGQIPLYYNHKNTGRPLASGKWFQKFRSNYLDVTNEPLYPFGFGLSYTTFSYSDIMLNRSSIGPSGSLTATVTVTNTGALTGREVVQLYIRDMVGSITRPVKELKGFQKIELKAGESSQVSFTVSANDLRFYNSELKYVQSQGFSNYLSVATVVIPKKRSLNWCNDCFLANCEWSVGTPTTGVNWFLDQSLGNCEWSVGTPTTDTPIPRWLVSHQPRGAPSIRGRCPHRPPLLLVISDKNLKYFYKLVNYYS